MVRGCAVPQEMLTKTITQHTKALDEETLVFLRGIAEDYAKVKNAVYQRYAGIRHVNRLTPVYDILNEMRVCGLREQLNLPVVYYELAVADAVTDIKSNWAALKKKINTLVSANENLSDEERLYIRTVLKINSTFSAVLNAEPYEVPDKVKDLDLDTDRLNNRIRRMVRKHLARPKTANAQLFKVSPNGYRYKDGGIWLVSRVPRHRVFLPLKNREQYDRQIVVVLGTDSATLHIPVATQIKRHEDYTNTVYMHIGSETMFTLSDGAVYGEELGQTVYPETLRLDRKNRERGRLYREAERYREDNLLGKAQSIERNNLGRKKYESQKMRERANTVRYINTEINRLLREEKPARIIIPNRVMKNRTKCYSRTANLKLTRNFQGFIRERLRYKCRLNCVELVEINSKGTGSLCAVCGAQGRRQRQEFLCENCGSRITIALNAAKNVEKKYREINPPTQGISG